MAITNQQLNDKLDELLSEVKANRRDIGTISVAITGTVGGEPGINQKLAHTSTRIEVLEGAENSRRRWVGAGVIAAITSAIGALVAAITGHG